MIPPPERPATAAADGWYAPKRCARASSRASRLLSGRTGRTWQNLEENGRSREKAEEGRRMEGEILERLEKSLLDLDMDAALEITRSIVEAEASVEVQRAVDALSQALEIVGRRFQEGEWFVTELVYAGEIVKAAMELLSPLLAAGAAEQLGSVVVGTVAGDLHDLGKDIFTNYAQSAGFQVIDLGVDVPAERFASAVTEHRPVALGMSCLLTVTAGEVGKVIEELKSRGVRDRVKVIVGGAALTEEFAVEVGADAFAPDAVTGTDLIREWSASQ
jgi:methanogenic corrinoid protein MtbC1